jgi:hypothetical protein
MIGWSVAPGNDVLNGGPGQDTYVVGGGQDVVVIDSSRYAELCRADRRRL